MLSLDRQNESLDLKSSFTVVLFILHLFLILEKNNALCKQTLVELLCEDVFHIFTNQFVGILCKSSKFLISKTLIMKMIQNITITLGFL